MLCTLRDYSPFIFFYLSSHRYIAFLLYIPGVNIVRKALKIPAYQIASNAGVDAAEVINRILTEKDGVGYDALNDEFVDMISAGILDPTKVRSSPYRNSFLQKWKDGLYNEYWLCTTQCFTASNPFSLIETIFSGSWNFSIQIGFHEIYPYFETEKA